jgi:hypothetical protein
VDALAWIDYTLYVGASILFFTVLHWRPFGSRQLDEHKESRLGAAWSGRSLSTFLRSGQARLAVNILKSK